MANKMEENNWQNNEMGGMAMIKCEDWQKESFYNEIKCKHFQGWYGGLQFSNVYTSNGFSQITCEFTETNSRTFFHKLIEQFVNRRLANTWEFFIHKIHESSITTLINSM